MARRSVSILLSLLLLFAAMPVPALGTTIGADVTQNLPIESRMETIADAVYLNTQLAAQNGSAALVQDRAKGKYAVKTTIGDVYGSLCAQYTLASSGLFPISEYSQVSVWAKPAAGAKWIEFRTNQALILGDVNNDGRYQVGKDLIGGKWNLVKLDLSKTTPKITHGCGLIVKTNEISTWYFDEITSYTSTMVAVNLARLKNDRTRIMANGSLQFNPSDDGAFNTTPTLLISESMASNSYTESSQANFQTGELVNVVATAAYGLELKLSNQTQPGNNSLLFDQYTKLMVHMDSDFDDDAQGLPASVTDFPYVAGKFGNGGTISSYSTSVKWPGLTAAGVGNGDWTIDFWKSIPVDNNWHDLFRSPKLTYCECTLGQYGPQLSFTDDSGAGFSWYAKAPSTGAWQHVALVKSGTNVYFYVDGLVKKTFTNVTGTFDNLLTDFQLKNASATGACVDELRISIGVARYNGTDFIPPTQPYAPTSAYAKSGNRTFQLPALPAHFSSSLIRWTEETSPNTAVAVYASYDGGNNWLPCKNGGQLPDTPSGECLIQESLYTQDAAVTPRLKSLSIDVIGDYVDSPVLPNGKINRIFIDSTYAASSAQDTALPGSQMYLTLERPSKVALSGNGSRIVFKTCEPTKIGKLYLLDLITGKNTKLSDIVPVDFKVNYDGSKIALRDSSDTLYLITYLNPDSVSTATIAPTVTKYAINKDGTLSYYKNNSTSLHILGASNQPAVSQSVYTGNLNCFDLAGKSEQMYFANDKALNKVVLTPAGWRTSVMSTVYSNITGLWANQDGSMIYMKQADGNYYVYEAYSKSLRRLNLNASAIVKITDDNRIVAQDADYNCFIYNPETDQSADIRSSNAKNPSSGAEVNFDVNNAGDQIAYLVGDANGSVLGVSVSMLNPATVAAPQRPERYLFSFDGKNSWLSYKDGDWTEVTSGLAPEKADFDKYGMTIDQVNRLTERDFAGLYEDGRQVFTFDVAVWFASVNPYITPSLNGILVTLSRSNNGFGNELTEKALFAAKQQTFDGANWRKVRKVYPVELSPKDAEMYYFIKVDDNYLSYKEGVWQTVYGTVYGTPTGEPLLDDVEANWIKITFQGMTASELRSIPESALTEKLANKSFAVVYCMKVLDETTKAYKSQVHVDYVEGLFNQSSLTLNLIYNDGKTKQYTGLTNAQVEDFMQWVSERQFNRGPVFYRIKVGGNNDFINYYMIQSVNVLEQ